MSVLKRLITTFLIGLLGFIGYQVWSIYNLTGSEPDHYFEFNRSCQNVDDEIAREAFIFGRRIQTRVEESDLEGLLALVNGELIRGPRKAFIQDKDFEAVIGDHTVDSVLSTDLLCTSRRDGSYHLGKGAIWYKQVNGDFTITSINEPEEPRDQYLRKGWQINNYTLPPECISINADSTLNECITTSRPYELQGDMIRSRLSVSESINYIGDRRVALEVCDNHLSSANERCVSSSLITVVSIAGNQEKYRYLLLAIVNDNNDQLSMRLLAEYPTRNIALNSYDQDHKSIKNMSFSTSQKIKPIIDGACSFGDYVKSKGAFNPLNAYNFGSKIIESIKKQDSIAFASLIQDELVYGPMKSELITNGLGELLDEKTIEQIINDGSTCQMYSDGLFSLGLGGVYYTVRQDSLNYQNVWDIYSLPSAKVLENKSPKKNDWSFNGQIMSRECFSTEWSSSDNYEEYAEQFGIADLSNMSAEIGKYFGREISTLEPIRASWDKEISLARELDACTFKLPPIYDNGYVWPEEYLNEKREIGGYRVIGMLPIEQCNELAPSIGSPCLSAAVVDLYYPAARAPFSNNYYAYGLFLNEDGERYIVPLRNFGSLNSARSSTGGHEALSSKGLCLIDGKSIELEGTVELETFAGPPNYESIDKGDKELKYWILTVDEPINCAYAYSFEREMLVAKKGSFNRFQLVGGNAQQYKRVQDTGGAIVVSGELMAGHTGYHQTDYLLFVKGY